MDSTSDRNDAGCRKANLLDDLAATTANSLDGVNIQRGQIFQLAATVSN